jgi:hypothetical protein
MARYNTVVGTTSISGAQTISAPTQGLLTTLSGTAPYQVNLPSPALYSGIPQTFYNAAGGNVTFQTPSGVFVGPGSSGTTLQVVPSLASITFSSDGTNYIISSSVNAYVDQLVTSNTSFNLLTATATSISAFTAATTLNIGATSGTLTLNNPTVVGNSATQTLYNTTATTVNAFGAATAISMGSNSSAAVFTIASTKAATNTTTGALVVGGGIAANGAIYGTQIWENTSRLTSIGKAIAMALVFGG